MPGYAAFAGTPRYVTLVETESLVLTDLAAMTFFILVLPLGLTYGTLRLMYRLEAGHW